MNNKAIDASILIVSYNHGPYIQRCLSSILAQETNRTLEIVWYDDHSNDDTISMGEEVLKNCRHGVFRLHAMNNRMQRKIPFLLDIIERCRGEFVFITDGDDFWIDPKKIDSQIDALKENPGINICFTPAFTFNGNELQPTGILGAHGENSKIFTLDNVIEGDGGFMPTNSLCVRRDVYDNAPDWLYGNLPVGDYPIQVIASHPNGAIYLPKVTCGYRRNIAGSWMNSVFNISNKRLEFEISFIELLKKLNDFLPGYNPAFRRISTTHIENFFRLCIENNDYSKLSRLTAALDFMQEKSLVK
jgi:glycosyltransferase involved in cell wall biosynthesis